MSLSLFEKEEKLGGKLNLAKTPPIREAIGKIVDYYGHVLAKLGVELRLRSEATEEEIIREKPDEVILAIGAKPDQQLETSLRSRGLTLHSIGDCKEVRNPLEAIYEGAQLSLGI